MKPHAYIGPACTPSTVGEDCDSLCWFSHLESRWKKRYKNSHNCCIFVFLILFIPTYSESGISGEKITVFWHPLNLPVTAFWASEAASVHRSLFCPRRFGTRFKRKKEPDGYGQIQRAQNTSIIPGFGVRRKIEFYCDHAVTVECKKCDRYIGHTKVFYRYWRMQNNCTTSDRFKRFVFQRCRPARWLLAVNVKKKHTQCKYADIVRLWNGRSMSNYFAYASTMDIQKCFTVTLDIQKCFTVALDIQKCFTVTLDIQKCFTVTLDITKIVDFYYSKRKRENDY